MSGFKAAFQIPKKATKIRKQTPFCVTSAPYPFEAKRVFEGYLRGWFLGADLKDIKRENVKEFMLWAFFNRDGPPGNDDDELEEYVQEIENYLGRPIEKGRGKAVALRLTLDKVKMLHRSLLWYTCVGIVDCLTHIKMLYYGFHFYRLDHSRFFTIFPFRPMTLFCTKKSPAKNSAYWLRPHTSKTHLPIVFLHGIGIGIYPYICFLKEINPSVAHDSADPDNQIGIIVIEIMSVSFRLTHATLSNKEICSQIDQILLNHFSPEQKFVFVAHSFGTSLVSLYLKTSSANRVKSIMLIDPIPIMLHLPTVAYNFTRRKPVRANEHQLYYFASMDCGVAHALGRHFFWNEIVLWKEDLERRNITVCLGSHDLIVDTDAVGRYLSSGYDGESTMSASHCTEVEKTSESEVSTRKDFSKINGCKVNTLSTCHGDDDWKYRPWRGTGIDILWFQDLDHAQVFDKYATRRKMVDAIRTYCFEGHLENAA
ncbi:hypothetical protein K3495_g11127 [Podosphaera aphanis]|nr:hypothetical protein K3495_g11127 [Podosphaera aphanis]